MLKSARVVEFHRGRAEALSLLATHAEHIRALAQDSRMAVSKFLFHIAMNCYQQTFWTASGFRSLKESESSLAASCAFMESDNYVGACGVTGILAGFYDTLYNADARWPPLATYDCEHCDESFVRFRDGIALNFLSDTAMQSWLDDLTWWCSDDYDAI